MSNNRLDKMPSYSAFVILGNSLSTREFISDFYINQLWIRVHSNYRYGDFTSLKFEVVQKCKETITWSVTERSEYDRLCLFLKETFGIETEQ